MHNQAIYLVLAGMLMVLAACSSAPTELTVEEDKWAFEVRAINLVLRAAADVNSVSGRPHSIVVGLFQLNDPSTFSGLSVTREGAVELLQKGKIDESIVAFQLLTMRPGEQKTVSISRAESAKFIGVISGYFKLNPKTDVKIFAIPVRAVERGFVEKTLAWASLVTDEANAVPDKLNVIIDLGRTGSRQIVVLEKEAVGKTKAAKKQETAQEKSWFGTLKADSVPVNK